MNFNARIFRKAIHTLANMDATCEGKVTVEAGGKKCAEMMEWSGHNAGCLCTKSKNLSLFGIEGFATSGLME